MSFLFTSKFLEGRPPNDCIIYLHPQSVSIGRSEVKIICCWSRWLYCCSSFDLTASLFRVPLAIFSLKDLLTLTWKYFFGGHPLAAHIYPVRSRNELFYIMTTTPKDSFSEALTDRGRPQPRQLLNCAEHCCYVFLDPSSLIQVDPSLQIRLVSLSLHITQKSGSVETNRRRPRRPRNFSLAPNIVVMYFRIHRPSFKLTLHCKSDSRGFVATH